MRQLYFYNSISHPRLINRASDLIEEEKLDETQAGLITLAAKAALEIHKQSSIKLCSL
jgi:hypothetical protein